jgi:hypothetical protein
MAELDYDAMTDEEYRAVLVAGYGEETAEAVLAQLAPDDD